MSLSEPPDCANCLASKYFNLSSTSNFVPVSSVPYLKEIEGIINQKVEGIETRLKTIEMKLDNFRNEYHENSIDYHPQNDGIPPCTPIGPMKKGYGPLDIKGTHDECNWTTKDMLDYINSQYAETEIPVANDKASNDLQPNKPVVILDWDGTVVDLGRNWKGAMYRIFMDNLPAKAQEHFKEITNYINDSEGKHTTEQFQWMIDFGKSLECGWEPPILSTLINKFEDEMVRLCWDKMNSSDESEYVVPGALRYIDDCAKNNIDVYVVSGSLKEHIVTVATKLGVYHLLKGVYAISRDNILNGKMFSKDEGVKQVISLYPPGTPFIGFGDTESDMELYRVNGVGANLVGMNKPFPQRPMMALKLS